MAGDSNDANADSDADPNDLKAVLAKKDLTIAELHDTVASLQKQIDGLKDLEDSADSNDLKAVVAKQDLTIAELHDTVASLRKQIDDLKASQSEEDSAQNNTQPAAKSPENPSVVELPSDGEDPLMCETATSLREQSDKTAQNNTQAAANLSPENPIADVPMGDVLPMDAEPAKRPKKVWICECGYDAKGRKNRLTNHQKQFCRLIPRSVKTDFFCPVCKIQKLYDAIKSHLLQFTNPNRKNETRKTSPHASIPPQYHVDILKQFKAKFGPKKI